MNKQNMLLSFPRSGNHLMRFFIELLSEIPTFGFKYNKNDKEIYKNIFNENIPFNIKINFDKNDCYYKHHTINTINYENTNNLIIILRNPREVLLRENGDKINLNKRNNDRTSYYNYFYIIDFYNNFNGKKKIFYYEDMLNNKVEFINDLYNFLELNNENKKNYVINNIEKLYNLSLNGKNRDWGGNNSNQNLEYYYKKIDNNIKQKFDNFLENKLKDYTFLKEKYNI